MAGSHLEFGFCSLWVVSVWHSLAHRSHRTLNAERLYARLTPFNVDVPILLLSPDHQNDESVQLQIFPLPLPLCPVVFPHLIWFVYDYGAAHIFFSYFGIEVKLYITNYRPLGRIPQAHNLDWRSATAWVTH